MFRVYVLIIGLLLPWLAHAEFVLPRYKGMDILTNDVEVVENWRLALSKPQKIQGTWQFPEGIEKSGELTKTLYLLRNHDQINEVATYYNTWTQLESTTSLFTCRGRACGSSNEWANRQFQQRRLYGVDGKQYYWALQSGDQYMALYLVERGNRQKLLYVELLKTNSQNSESPQ